jgi:hypothetical protein
MGVVMATSKQLLGVVVHPCMGETTNNFFYFIFWCLEKKMVVWEMIFRVRICMGE